MNTGIKVLAGSLVAIVLVATCRACYYQGRIDSCEELKKELEGMKSEIEASAKTSKKKKQSK